METVYQRLETFEDELVTALNQQSRVDNTSRSYNFYTDSSTERGFYRIRVCDRMETPIYRMAFSTGDEPDLRELEDTPALYWREDAGEIERTVSRLLERHGFLGGGNF